MQVNHEVLTELQEAQVMVASYPFFPDRCWSTLLPQQMAA